MVEIAYMYNDHNNIVDSLVCINITKIVEEVLHKTNNFLGFSAKFSRSGVYYRRRRSLSVFTNTWNGK